jgi:methionyl aminopeptidase
MVISRDEDIDSAAAAAAKVVETHRRLVDFLRAGQTLAEIDAYVGRTLEDLGCRSAFIGYRMRGHPPFPSHACLSVNECVVHGTHDMTAAPLRPGDILSVDIGVRDRGWIGDAAWTYAIEEASDVAAALMRCGRESLRRGLAAIRPGRPLIDWAKAVQQYVERDCGYCLVRGLGGHGYGRDLHGPPFVANVVPSYPGEWPDAWKPFVPGMLLALEPMIALSTTEIRGDTRAWPIWTADRSLSVHYEADILVTPDGIRDLTAGLAELPDVVGR